MTTSVYVKWLDDVSEFFEDADVIKLADGFLAMHWYENGFLQKTENIPMISVRRIQIERKNGNG